MPRAAKLLERQQFRVLDDAHQDRLSLELKGAYPAEAGLDALRRTVSLERDGPRGRVEVVDQVQFAAGPGSFESVLITFGQVVEIAPSTVLMRDHRGALRVTFDAQAVTPRVELIEQVDLAEGPTDVRRVVFGLSGAAAEGTIRLVIEPA